MGVGGGVEGPQPCYKSCVPQVKTLHWRKIIKFLFSCVLSISKHLKCHLISSLSASIISQEKIIIVHPTSILIISALARLDCLSNKNKIDLAVKVPSLVGYVYISFYFVVKDISESSLSPNVPLFFVSSLKFSPFEQQDLLQSKEKVTGTFKQGCQSPSNILWLQ